MCNSYVEHAEKATWLNFMAWLNKQFILNVFLCYLNIIYCIVFDVILCVHLYIYVLNSPKSHVRWSKCQILKVLLYHM